MANYFIHNGTLNIEGKKMSKSAGNVTLLTDTLQNYHGSIIRLNMLRTLQTTQLIGQKEVLNKQKIQKKMVYPAAKDINTEANKEVPKEVFESLFDDMNTPMAITHMHEYFNKQEYDKLYASLYFLGIDLKSFNNSIKREKISKINEEEIHVLIEERNLARANKDFKKSDEIRNKLEIMGIRLRYGKWNCIGSKLSDQG